MNRFIASVVLSISILLCLHPPLGAQGMAGAKIAGNAGADQIHFSIISRTAMTFDWVGGEDNIVYGLDPHRLSTSARATPSAFLPVTSPWVSDPGPYWEAKLTGLKQNTLYYYRIGRSGKVHTFRTPPAPGTAGFRICTTSDLHNSSPECAAMFSQIAEFKPAFVISTGDLTGAGPYGQNEVSKRFRAAMVWSQDAAWMPVEGNHDWEYPKDDDLRTFKGRFDIPNPGTISDSPKVSCCGEDWGWFDYGNTRFISWPEPWTSSTWKEWKAQVATVFSDAQKDPKIAFIVTFGHRSAYTSTAERYPGEADLRLILDGFHAACSKYVLDLSGHNHQYERYLLPGGMNYVINSTTGSYYHDGWATPTKPPGCVFRAIHYGILVLDITDTAIEGKFVCSVNTRNPTASFMPEEEHVCSSPGAVIDAFTIPAVSSGTK